MPNRKKKSHNVNTKNKVQKTKIKINKKKNCFSLSLKKVIYNTYDELLSKKRVVKRS